MKQHPHRSSEESRCATFLGFVDDPGQQRALGTFALAHCIVVTPPSCKLLRHKQALRRYLYQRFCSLLFFACFVLDAPLELLPVLELLLLALANSSLPFPFFHILPSVLSRRSSRRFLSLPDSFCLGFFPSTDSGPFSSALPAF